MKGDAPGRRIRLHFVSQHVEVAALAVMQVTPNGIEEINRVHGIRRGAGAAAGELDLSIHVSGFIS